MNAVLTFRPAVPDDEPFLRELRGQFDAERLFIQYWDSQDEALKRNILTLQFQAHERHFQQVKGQWETKDNIIELDGKPIGRFIVNGDRDEIHLADIIIEKNYRGCGIGRAVLDMTKAECEQSKRPLRLHVDKFASAVQFYLNQGFRTMEETASHYLMEWRPASLLGKTQYFF